MARILIIANPAASGFTGASLRAVTWVLQKRFEVDTEWPTSAAGSRAAAAAAAAAGYEAVAAMGGDGVAHQVANGLVHTDTALAVIPAGTTNVLARMIGLPSKPAKAARALVGGAPRAVTLAHVTDGTRSDHALFALGIGFDADVVRESERRPLAKGTLGALHYLRSAASVAIRDYRAKPPNLRATCDGESINAVSVMVQVHTPYTYFGPLAVRLTDDTSDGPAAFAATELPIRRALSIASRSLAKRDVAEAGGVEIWHGFQKLIVEADPKAPIQADGDLLGTGDYFEITPAPGALKLLLPR
jgi:diacylglycerol kinase family enzyme